MEEQVMLPTYKAILRGNHVEWLGDGDQQPALDDPVAVNITILDEPVAPEGVERRGKLMAAALERLAEIKALPDVVDPALWESEIRQDRVMPGRLR
jgi:hypothetical protein